MISIHVIFWLMVIFFALIGYLRGWQKEVIALTGLIASISALNQFGYPIVTFMNNAPFVEPIVDADPLAMHRREFMVQAIFHVVIAFFSYQVVARLADVTPGGKLGARLRGALEKQIIGAIVGAANGYLLVGGLWGFLEYRITENGYERLLPLNQPYPFEMDVLTRPAVETAAMSLAEYLPMGVLTPAVWLILFFAAFFIVIIALI